MTRTWACLGLGLTSARCPVPRRLGRIGRSSAGRRRRASRTGRACRDRWSATENVRLEAGSAGPRLVLADRLGTARVPDDGGEQGESETPRKGLYLGGNRPDPPKSEHEWKVLCLDLAQRPRPVGADRASRRAAERHPSEEQLRLRDARDRRPARVRLLRQRRSVRVRSGRESRVVAAFRTAADPRRLGPGRLARVAPGSPVPGQRQRGAVLPAGLGQTHGRDRLACRARREKQLGHAVCLGARGTDGVGDQRHGQGPLVWLGRSTAVVADRDVQHHDSHAAGGRRIAVRQFGLRDQPAASGLRDPAGGGGRHLAPGRGDLQRGRSPGVRPKAGRTIPRPCSTSSGCTCCWTWDCCRATTRTTGR